MSHSCPQVFATPEWAVLGFPIVEPDLRDEAVTKLKIASHPPTNRLVSLLEKSPPAESDARAWFEILANRVGGESDSSFHPYSSTDCIASCRLLGGRTQKTVQHTFRARPILVAAWIEGFCP